MWQNRYLALIVLAVFIISTTTAFYYRIIPGVDMIGLGGTLRVDLGIVSMDSLLSIRMPTTLFYVLDLDTSFFLLVFICFLDIGMRWCGLHSQ